MSTDADKAKREALEATNRRAVSGKHDLHEAERRRALERYLAAEAYEEERLAEHEPAAPEHPVETKVTRRRQTSAAQTMRRQVRGCDEVPRQAP